MGAKREPDPKVQAALDLLESWANAEGEDAEEQRETGEYLMEALDRDRLSYRRRSSAIQYPPPRAELVLDTVTLERIAALYDETYDAEVFSDEFRRPIADRGYLTAEELATIVVWKSPRQKTSVTRNRPDIVEAVTPQAFMVDEPWLAVWILSYLDAVQVRVASAILTAYDPDYYTVLDVRAWAALDRLRLLEPLDLAHFGGSTTVDLNSCEVYAAYLGACHRLAQSSGVSLRTLDRCLWTIDKQGPEALAQHGIGLDALQPSAGDG